MTTDIDLTAIKFDENGLVPAIVQDEDGQVLMLAYMNAESLGKTLATGYTWFYSRSRRELWHKGNTSGHVQRVLSVEYDCDGDALLVRVRQTGVACHTGRYSCFYRELPLQAQTATASNPPATLDQHPLATVLRDLYRVIQSRKLQPVAGSYTNYLFSHGQDKILKKIGEEATETVIASKNQSGDEVVYEMGDLWYHCLVLLAYHNLPPEAVLSELRNRRRGGAYHEFTGKTGERPDD